MVERPIKKSERQVKAETNDTLGDLKPDPNNPGDSQEGLQVEAQLSQKPTSPNKQDRDKSNRKEKRSRQKTEEPNRSNPALLRGPRPTKPKPPPVVHTEEVSPAESSASSDENVTSTES